jgi:tRNA G10  N-methylase Trm11
LASPENGNPLMVQSHLREFNGKKSDNIVAELERKPWTVGEYKKQTWGIRLHNMSPYVGRMKPSLAHWLVRICSKPGEVVLDPFCGIGTVPLEADLLRRRAIGIELNPYALVISKAKFDRRPLHEQIEWLRKVKLDLENVDIENIPDSIKQFYHEKTLRELLALKKRIEEENRTFLLGCLLGISHGHRPQHLSSITGYIVPYKYAKHKPEYKPVIPKMIAKVKRMYSSPFPKETSAYILKGDARALPFREDSIDVVISSPPYYSTIDYVESNWLRLQLLGIVEDQKIIKENLIQHERTYLTEMRKVGNELRRVLKCNSLCVFVLGDFPKKGATLNTAENVRKIFSELGFSSLGIIEDEIPITKRTAVKWIGGEALKSHPKKFDRILVMRIDK